MYMRVYENRIETNEPLAPFLCLTMDICLIDNAYTAYYDKPPFRVGPCAPPCCCVPLTCCGPPVIFSFKPVVCCVGCGNTLGTQLFASPCNCFGFKSYLCCGNPCYVNFKAPFLPGPMGSSAPLKNAEELVAVVMQAVQAYQQKHSIPENEGVIFENVSDNIADFGGAKKSGAPKTQEMDDRKKSAKTIL
jgi:hypothetical protein